MLTEQVKQKVLQHHQELKDSGKLLPQQQQDQYYTSFRSRFGPMNSASWMANGCLKPCTEAKAA